MKKAFVLLSSLSLLSAVGMRAAHADVAWEHRGSVKIGAKPVLTFSLNNQWSGQRHRAVFSADATKAFAAIAPSNTKPVTGSFQVIERLDDDRLILSSPEAKTVIDEPLSTLKSRLRLNFWEALGSNLSATDVPQLTPEQRQRLGQEIRAVVTPFSQKYLKTYFRPLTETRVIGGLTSRGYRFTSKLNVSDVPTRPEVISLTAEWWLADAQTGDDEIRAFTQNVNNTKEKDGPATASMWANETYPVMWEAAPVEAHQALDSLIGVSGSPNFGYQGTPVQFYLTLAAPPSAGLGADSSIRVALELAQRNTSGIQPAVFEAPTGYQKIAIEPFIGMAQNFINMSRGQLESLLK